MMVIYSFAPAEQIVLVAFTGRSAVDYKRFPKTVYDLVCGPIMHACERRVASAEMDK